jgi:Mannosyltransferase (PIG-V)
MSMPTNAQGLGDAAATPTVASAPATRAPWWRAPLAATARARQDPALRDALLAAGCCLLVSALAGISCYLFIGPIAPKGALDPPGLVDHMGRVRDVLASPFARWDSAWYLLTAQRGYGPSAGSPAFYPLYPLLVAIVGSLGVGDLVAGVLISVASLIVALRLIWLLTRLELGERYPQAPRLAVWATALFPTAFFLIAVYSESLFLALSVGALWSARRGRWPLAGALGGLAAATRPSGVLILLGLALVYLRADPARRRRDALWLALVPAGLGAYLGWLSLHGLDPLSPLSAQGAWMRGFAGPINGCVDGLRAALAGARQLLSGQSAHVYWPAATAYGYTPMQAARYNLELLAFLAFALAALVGALRRLAPAYSAYATVVLAAAVSYPVPAQPLSGLSRILLVIFPLQMATASWLSAHRRWRLPALALCTMALAYYAGSFATWHWVA